MPRARAVWIGVAVIAVAVAAILMVRSRPETSRTVQPPLALPEPHRFAPEVIRQIDASLANATQAPASAASRGAYAMTLHANGALRTADAVYGQTITLAEEDPRWWFLRGCARIRLGDTDGALADFGAAIDRRPATAGPWWNRGFLFLDLGRIDAAEADFRMALQQSPGHPGASAGLARVMLERGEPQRSIELLDPFVGDAASAPFTPYVHGLIARALQQVGEEDRARLHRARAEPQFPAWPDPELDRVRAKRAGYGYRLERVLEMLDADQDGAAITELESLLIDRPNDLTALVALASAYANTGREADASTTLERVLAIDPNHIAGNLNLAMIELRRGDVGAAAPRLQGVLQRDPRNGMAHERLAQIQLMSGDTETAIRSLEQAFAFGFESLEARIQACRLYNALDRSADARAMLEPLLERWPSNPSVWVTWAWTCANLGDPARMRDAIARARALQPRDPFDLQLLNQLEGKAASP